MTCHCFKGIGSQYKRHLVVKFEKVFAAQVTVEEWKFNRMTVYRSTGTFESFEREKCNIAHVFRSKPSKLQ